MDVINGLASTIRKIRQLDNHGDFFAMDVDKLVGVLISEIVYCVPRERQALILFENGLEEYIEDLDERWMMLDDE